MKLYIKKTYCSNCQRLVHTKEQKANNITRVQCVRCGRPLWVHDGLTWHGARETV